MLIMLIVAKTNSQNTSGKAIVLSNIRKMLDGKQLGFSGVFNGAKRTGMVNTEAIAAEFGFSARDVNNWSKQGKAPILKTQVKVLEYILDRNT